MSDTVFTAMRSEIDGRLPSWRATARVFGTRSGRRYRGHDLALLLAPPLRRFGLRRTVEGSNWEEIFVTATGRHVPVRELVGLLGRALGDHEDQTLAASVASPTIARDLIGFLPEYEGPVTRVREDATKTRTPLGADEVESVAEFLRRFVTEETPTVEVHSRYVREAERSGRAALGRTRFYEAVAATGLVERRHRRTGDVLVPIREEAA